MKMKLSIKDALMYGLLTILIFIILFQIFRYLDALGSEQAEVIFEEPVIEEPIVEQKVFNVDGVECWFDTRPYMIYNVTDQTVQIDITCNVDVLDAYLPAIERTQ
jgi:hypothetical protein